MQLVSTEHEVQFVLRVDCHKFDTTHAIIDIIRRSGDQTCRSEFGMKEAVSQIDHDCGTIVVRCVLDLSIKMPRWCQMLLTGQRERKGMH